MSLNNPANPLKYSGSIEVDATLMKYGNGTIGVTSPVQGIMTEAEYNVLQEEKKNRGLYIIKDISGSENEPSISRSYETSIIINGQKYVLPIGLTLPGGTVAIKPLTKAEYAALSDDEKNADVVYLITDEESGQILSGGSSGEVYSEEETIVGMFLGEILYRKVFLINPPEITSTDAWTYLIPPLKNANIWSSRCIEKKNTQSILLPHIDPTSNGSRAAEYYYDTELGFGFHGYGTWTNPSVVCVIAEYTKTIDTTAEQEG